MSIYIAHYRTVRRGEYCWYRCITICTHLAEIFQSRLHLWIVCAMLKLLAPQTTTTNDQQSSSTLCFKLIENLISNRIRRSMQPS